MTDRISKTLSERNQFLNRLEKDFEKNAELEVVSAKHLQELESTIKNITELGKQPEHPALLPLTNNLYMNGRIVHTGEYYVEKKAYPDSYFVLQTLNQTIKSLEDRVAAQKDVLKKITTAKEQLKERENILRGIGTLSIDDSNSELESGVTDDMPQEIQSDKGVAVKVGGFYEIIEFEE